MTQTTFNDPSEKKPVSGEEPAKDDTEMVIQKTIEKVFNDTIAVALKDPLVAALNETAEDRAPQYLTNFILAAEFVDGDGDVGLRIINSGARPWRTAGLLKALQEWGELGHAVSFGWSAIAAQEDDDE